MSDERPQETLLFGHPTGLFTLFFSEMWERFSFYGMRALLVFYMIKGFLGYNDSQAYGVYGAYLGLVYATPFIGGMLADRLLGARRAVVTGGLLMAAGHLLMTVEDETAFFAALALIICGNGFFKPNISTMVGSLYPKGSHNRDGGFTIFYMGINLGAAMSPLVCGYVGETYGWHYGFGLATIGMLVGLAVFVAPIRVTQLMILGGAIATAVGLFFWQNTPYELVVNGFVAIALLIAGIIAFVALGRGGLPDATGRPPDPAKLKAKVGGFLRADFAVYLGILVAIPILVLLLQRDKIAGGVLFTVGGAAFVWLIIAAFRSSKIERERLFVVLILMFFSILFWAFFEQAGSSINNFTDRNVDRVTEERVIAKSDVGKKIVVKANQELLGYKQDGRAITLTVIDKEKKAFRKRAKKQGKKLSTETATLALVVTDAHVGMGINGDEVPASKFQSANPIFILIFGLLFTALWLFLSNRSLEPKTPYKFAFGLLQLALGFGALWYGAQHANDRGMVSVVWLLLGYGLHTTGELCLSPVGLSMVTKLSPKRIVSTVMGAWFLATAFADYLSGLIAMLTGIGGGHGSTGETTIPVPSETVNVYGDVFGTISVTGIICAAICFALAPLLSKWMHTEVEDN